MSRRAARVLASVIAAIAATSATAQQTVPTLHYDPPANFYRSASTFPEQYSSNEVNASFQVYPFRPFTGDIQQLFQQTLLRDWIGPQYREGSGAGQPIWSRGTVPGAQAVLIAHFVENMAGVPHEHVRVLIVAAGAAAITDASALSGMSWQRVGPALNAVHASLRVVSVAAPPPVASGPGPAGRLVAGMYLGTKPRYKVNLNRPVGSGDWVTAMHYYLLSPDGRVYRGYDMPTAPGGDLSRFDYDAAQRDDPDNSGRYTVQGNQLYIQMGGQQPEAISTAVPAGNRLVVNTVVYLRQ